MNMKFEDYKRIIACDEHRTLELKKTRTSVVKYNFKSRI